MKNLLSWALGALCILIFAGVAIGLPGDLDTSFGRDGDGIEILLDEPWEPWDPNATSGPGRILAPVLVESASNADVVVVASGRSGQTRQTSRGTVPVADWRLLRYDADGTKLSERTYFDEYDAGGFVSSFALDGSWAWMAGRAVRQTISGKGKRQKTVEDDTWLVVRVPASGATDGEIDAGFNGGAPLTLGTYTDSDIHSIGAIAVRSDGSALLVGRGLVTTASSGRGKKNRGTTSWGLVVVAVRTNGTIDTAYGDAGWVRYDVDPTTDDDDDICGAEIQSTGALVVNVCSVGLIRIDASGAVDPSFGTNGFVEESDAFRSLAVDADDNIYAASLETVTFEPTVYRYDEDGVVDTAFGTSGAVALSGFFGLGVHGLAVDEVDATKRRLVVLTGVEDLEDGGLVAVRILGDGYVGSLGNLDASFGPNDDGVSAPIRKTVDASVGAGFGLGASWDGKLPLWNAWDVSVDTNGDLSIADAVTVHSYEDTDGSPVFVNIEASVSRISGN